MSYKDLGLTTRVPEETSSHFRMQRLSDFYYSWGAGAADFNHDGVLDIVAGPYIYFGPDFTTRREIYLALTTNPSDEYTRDDWMQFAGDFTGDGWADVINCSFSPANRRRLALRQSEGRVAPLGQVPGGARRTRPRSRVIRDIDGDGKPELIYMARGLRALRQARSRRIRPGRGSSTPSPRPVTRTAHGIGVGDINGDGRMDIVNAYGWWEQPPAGSKQEPWTYHPEAFARYGRSVTGRQRDGRLRRERRRPQRRGDRASTRTASASPGSSRSATRPARSRSSST